MDRVILHSDINSAYANIECFHRPELRGQPVAVGGDTEKRHGIILAANPLAKRFGVRTGDAIWQAVQKCPHLVSLPANMPLYIDYCGRIKDIYKDYTPQQESFGLDESWLDCSGTGLGPEIAEDIRQRVKAEMGVTVSIGVSWNKIFAKLGSDLKKPDAVTVITKDNYKDVVWPLPASDLLYVGRATKEKLGRVGIRTIGQLAETNLDNLHRRLGKMGLIIHAFANGLDTSPVVYTGEQAPIKSIGNSTTTPKDIICEADVHIVYLALAESVSARLRECGLLCRGVQISIRDVDLLAFERQAKLSQPTMLTTEIHSMGMDLLRNNWHWRKPLRSVGIRAIDLIPADTHAQLSFFEDNAKRTQLVRLEHTIDKCRDRYGYHSLRRGGTMIDEALGGLDAKGTTPSILWGILNKGGLKMATQFVKEYVEVDARFGASGYPIPQAIIFSDENGSRQFHVERVVDIQKGCCADIGVSGLVYRVQIPVGSRLHHTKIYCEPVAADRFQMRWCVAKKAEKAIP